MDYLAAGSNKYDISHKKGAQIRAVIRANCTVSLLMVTPAAGAQYLNSGLNAASPASGGIREI